METFFYIYFTLYAIINLVFASRLFYKKDPVKKWTEANVSILIAARNEEHNILHCLQSLSEQVYPKERLQILIGDDRSEDRTGILIQEFIKDKPQFEYHYIEENLPHLIGKQNVLAQLAHYAKGDYFLITDADVTQHPDWVSVLVAPLKDQKIGLVSGATIVRATNLWSGFQAMDWIIGMSSIKALDTLGLPITSVGNNMAVSRPAYQAVGGYQNLPFSITEDYLLFDAILKKGYHHKWLFNASILNLSAPIGDIKTLLHQKRRWIKGGSSGPWYALVLFGFYSVANPVLLGACFMSELKTLACLAGIKFLSDFILLLIGSSVAKKKRWLKYFLPFSIFNFFYALLIGIYLLIPVKINWKGRIYSEKGQI